MTTIHQDLLLLLISIPALVCFGMGVALGLSLRRRIKCDWTAKEGGVTSINTGYVGCKRDDGYGESTTFRDRDYFASNGYKN